MLILFPLTHATRYDETGVKLLYNRVSYLKFTVHFIRNTYRPVYSCIRLISQSCSSKVTSLECSSRASTEVHVKYQEDGMMWSSMAWRRYVEFMVELVRFSHKTFSRTKRIESVTVYPNQSFWSRRDHTFFFLFFSPFGYLRMLLALDVFQHDSKKASRKHKYIFLKLFFFNYFTPANFSPWLVFLPAKVTRLKKESFCLIIGFNL